MTIDWIQPLRDSEIGDARNAAKRENLNAHAWKRHANALNQRCIDAVKAQHKALCLKEAWKMTATQLWNRLFPGQEQQVSEELMAIAKKNLAAVDKQYPYKGPR